MRLTIVPEDGLVSIDGKAFTVDCSSIDATIHAVQWYDDHGVIEYKTQPPALISVVSTFQTVIDLWIAANEAPPPPPPTPVEFLTPPALVASALGLIITPANADISSVGGVFNIAGAMYLDVGTYWLFFLVPQPDTNYFAIITGSAVDMTVTDRTSDYFVIEVKDAIGGAPIDPPQLSVQIFRIPT